MHTGRIQPEIPSPRRGLIAPRHSEKPGKRSGLPSYCDAYCDRKPSPVFVSSPRPLGCGVGGGNGVEGEGAGEAPLGPARGAHGPPPPRRNRGVGGKPGSYAKPASLLQIRRGVAFCVIRKAQSGWPNDVFKPIEDHHVVQKACRRPG